MNKTSISKLAHVKLKYAVDRGLLVKPRVCEKCGQNGKRLHGHHENYSKPLEVEWLCPPCHALLRKKPKIYAHKGEVHGPLGSYLKENGISYTNWAKEHEIPVPSISTHLAYERGVRPGRPLGFDLACKVVLATGGAVTLEDIVPRHSAMLEQINCLPGPNDPPPPAPPAKSHPGPDADMPP